MLCIISAYFVGLVIYGFDNLAVCSAALACGSRIRAGSCTLLGISGTCRLNNDKTLRVFKPALREIARPNTAPTGRWLARRRFDCSVQTVFADGTIGERRSFG